MQVDVHSVRAVVEGVLTAENVPTEHARLQADLLIEAELRGHPSHGLLRLRRIVERIRGGLCDPSVTGIHQWSGSARLEVDGQRGLGPVIAMNAIDAISTRAAETGIATATIRNNNHLGMLSWYVEKIVARGQIVIATCTSEALVHAWGGRSAILGTNPIAIGIPAQPHPLVFDSATGIVSAGKIRDYANRGKPLEPGWALDASGAPTTDGAAAIEGSIAPFGGPKGYGLGLGLEVLVAALTGTATGTDVHGTLDSTQVSNKGDVFIVFDAPSDATVELIGGYLSEVRMSPPSEPGHPVQVPGDRARATRAKALENGIDVPESIWSDLIASSPLATDGTAE